MTTSEKGRRGREWVEANARVEASGCWKLPLKPRPETGYVKITIKVGVTPRAHRWVYEMYSGPIADGMQLDHICHTADCPGGPACLHRACVNPAHLRISTCRENLFRSDTVPALNAAKTHCKRGHPYNEVNTVLVRADRPQWRRCGRCRSEADQARRAAAGLPTGKPRKYAS